MHGLKVAFTGLPRQYNNLREEILDATDTVLRSGNLMSGEYTNQFESWLAQKNHSLHAITCHSGTQALEIIASFWKQYGLYDPSIVLIPASTYVATANAWRRAGWTIAIADTDSYGLMSLPKISKDIKIRAICPVGLYGHALSNKYYDWENTIFVEDAAQHWLSNNCKRMGLASAISFDPTKNFNNYGNGGAVITNDEFLNAFARDWIRNRSLHANGDKNHSTQTSTNSRMSEVDCAQMMVKTRYIDAWQTRRGEIAQHWMDRLTQAGIRSLIDASNYQEHCYHKFVIDVDRRDQLHQALADLGVETKIHYQDPIQNLKPYQDCVAPDMLGACYSLSQRCLSLPIYPELADSEVEYIIDSVINCV